MLIAQTDAVKASFTSMPSLKNCISIKLCFYRSKAAAVTSQSDDVTADVSGCRRCRRAFEERRPNPDGEWREPAGGDTRTGGCHPEETERDCNAGHPVITHTHRWL